MVAGGGSARRPFKEPARRADNRPAIEPFAACPQPGNSRMPHDADFEDAHRRHWADAELLFDRGRWPNADQLYGYSAECGLKAVMRSLGMEVKRYGVPASEEHRKHVQDIWPVFQSFVADRSGQRFLRWLPAGKPFADWSHHDRYAPGRHFDRAGTAQHRAAAQEIRGMVQSLAEDRRS